MATKSSRTSSSGRRRTRLQPDERRADILRAARNAFGERPYARVSLAEIAEAVGVSPALVAFHFGSKRALYIEVLRAAARHLLDGIRGLPGPPSLDRLAAGVRLTLEYAAAHRSGFLALLRGGQEAIFPEAAAVVEELRSAIVAQILTDMDRKGDPLVELALRAHIGYVDALTVAWLQLPDAQRRALPPATLAPLAVGAFRGALAAAEGQ